MTREEKKACRRLLLASDFESEETGASSAFENGSEIEAIARGKLYDVDNASQYINCDFILGSVSEL